MIKFCKSSIKNIYLLLVAFILIAFVFVFDSYAVAKDSYDG